MNRFEVFLFCMILFIGAFFVVLGGLPKHNVADEPADVTATTWSWAKVVGKPASIRSRSFDDSGCRTIPLMQVEFQVTDSETLTAFISIADMSGRIAPPASDWNVGDEVLIVGVPGMQKSNRGPSKTYFVVDWRKKKE